MKRTGALVAVAVVATVVMLKACSSSADRDSKRTNDVTATTADPGAPRAPTPPPSPATADVMPAATRDALLQAADLVQRYLQAAGAAEFEQADAMWVPGSLASHDEGGLRALLPARGLRIRNERPEPLDKASPPERVRVPVELRLTGADGHFHRYSGTYTVRRDPIAREWRIVAASVHAALDGQ